MSPVGAVIGAFISLVVIASVLTLTRLGPDGRAALATALTSAALLLIAIELLRRLPAHERRLAVAPKGSRRGMVLVGVAVGAGITVGSGAVIALGQALDPTVARRIDELDRELGTASWQVAAGVLALVVLAPLGEELLFRGLLLRALVRRVPFWPAALVSGAVWTASHADAYVLWPRAISILAVAMALSWLYRERGLAAAVIAHAFLNGVAATAVLLS